MASVAEGGPATHGLERVNSLPDELRACLVDGEHALTEAGDLRASRERFDRAYELAELAGEPEPMALAVLGLAGLWVSERRTVTGAAMLETRLAHVLSLLGAKSSLALRIRARLAAEADYRCGTHATILAVLAEAKVAEDPVALAEALSLAHHCLLGPAEMALRWRLASELTRASFRTERRSDRLMGLLWQTADAYAAGDMHAGRLLGELRGELSDRGHAAVGFVVSAIDVMLAIRAGRLDEAESLSAVCAAGGATAGDIDAEWWPGSQLVTIRWYQGRLPELLPMLQDRAHSSALSAVDNSTFAAVAVAAAQAGDRSVAASYLAALVAQDLSRMPRGSSWLVTMNGIAEAAYLLGEPDAATQVYELLRPHADLPMVGGLGVTCFGSTHQALGIAALTMRRQDEAIEHLTAAVRHNLALAHRPALVFTRQRLGLARQLRGQPGDGASGRWELQAAWTEAAALDMALPSDGGKVGVAAATCERAGRDWRVGLGGRSAVVESGIGLLHLAVLIANPRQEVPAADLMAGVASLTGGTGQPVLDAEAVVGYRDRLRRLEAQLDELAPGSDADRSAAAEREWLIGQLASAAGLGGRPRSFPDDSERARVAVGKAIRRALTRITAADAVIGEHLRRSVRTGTRCSYWP
jgi:hypothetical protein